ncbi:MAG: GtrA family protein [Saccharofermentanales bacterium]|jgi:putative flippase GtrA|nr:GtrA family protein [Eubacteriales bacterium]MDD3611105.1 GtrA family protein [Eubacteriales bacterium]HHU03532.1 GtrA family protein [Fastidiosipila sp.]
MASPVPLKSKESLVQAIKFTLLSLSAGLIEAGSFVLLERLTALSYDFKHVISIVLSVLWNFTLNRRYTFKSANNVPIAMIKVALFYVVFIPLTAWLGQMASNNNVNDYLIKIPTMLLNFVGEFLWWKFVVFRGTENTNKLAQEKAAKAD